MLKIIKKIFGDKHEKGIKDLWPIVEEIKEEYEKIKDLSDEQLKAKTAEFKEKIEQHTEETREKIDELKAKLQSDEEFDRQAAYDDVDELNEQLNEE